MTSQLKILTILGTRGEAIGLSRVIGRLDQQAHHVLVHTGPLADYEPADVISRDVEVRRPDHFLHINRETLGTILADIVVKVEAVIDVERPDAVLVLGDTDSAFAAVIARRMGISVYHLAAGNRSLACSVAEQLNGRMIDHVSDFNLVATEHARRNLLAEGIQPQRICVVGSPLHEVLDDNRAGSAKRETRDMSSRVVAMILSTVKRGHTGVGIRAARGVAVFDRLCFCAAPVGAKR